MTDYNKERIRHIQIKLEDNVDSLRNCLEDTKYIYDDKWKEIDQMITRIYLTISELKDELF